jgi:hypothetical protein
MENVLNFVQVQILKLSGLNQLKSSVFKSLLKDFFLFKI